jgi:DNA-binding transcriptional LysR family regulator
MHYIVPTLAAFSARYPELELELEIGFGDRLVDLVREGIDCAVRGARRRAARFVDGRAPRCDARSGDLRQR